MIYLLVPLLFLALTPFLFDSTTILRMTIISIVPLSLMLVKPINFSKYKVISIPFLLILFWYLLSWKINEQTYADFLFGFYGRGFGVLTLLGCFLTTLIVADSIRAESKKFLKNINRLIIFAIFYGLIQYIDLDPFQWESGYSGVLLTLGNTNFASAILGILSTVPLYKLINTGVRRNIPSIITTTLIIFLVLETNSSQGFVLILFNILVLSILFCKKEKCINNKRKLAKLLALFCSISFIPITFILNIQVFNNLVNFFNNAFQIESRLQHWSLAVRIWRDNPLFGVGVDGMGLNSSKYLSEYDAKIWGNYTFPDKAHNEFLDNFVNGGIVVGFMHLFSTIVVAYFALKLMRRQMNKLENEVLEVSTVMWFGYVLQSTFSTNQIFIKFFGAVLSGVVIGFYINGQDTNRFSKNYRKIS
jgi:O-antigen ligase